MENNELNSREGLRSLFLEIENFKNIEKQVVEMNGRSMLFIGKNGAGKSSLIQAMQSPLDAKVIPTEPIKKGEEKAKIIHKIGGNIKGQYVEYTLEIYFTPGNKKGRLVVYNENGEKQNAPATILKSLIGNVSFEVTKWMNEPKAKKLELIKNLSGAAKDIDMVNLDITKKKEELKLAKYRAEELEGALNNHEFSKEDIAKYSEPIVVDELQKSLSQVEENQKVWDRVNNGVINAENELLMNVKATESLDAEIEKLQHQIKIKEQAKNEIFVKSSQIENKLQQGKEWLAQTPRPESTEIVSKMNEAADHNSKHQRVLMLSGQQKEMINSKQKVEDIKSTVESLEAKRSDLIKKSQLPIEGLTFDDNELYIDGLPVEEGQLNTQRIWDIGVDIAMALNPNYKVIFLGDGSLFDKEHLRTIIKKIEDKDYMAIVEIVDRDGGNLETKFVEEEL